MADVEDRVHEEDAAELAKLGYKEELQRAWSGFSNFAISFTIISVLAGTFTTFGQAWNAGGPVAISIGWPVICLLVLTVAVSMSELTSAFPTAGGPYWWSARLGGPGWSWFTGWFNIVGLIGIVASVGYGAASFLYALLGLYGLNVLGINFGDDAARAARDLRAVPDHPRALRAAEHLQLAARRAVQQHLGRLARRSAWS